MKINTNEVTRRYEELKKGVDVVTAVMPGLSAGGATATAFDKTSFCVRTNVEFQQPHMPKAKQQALAKIIAATVMEFPNMPMADILMSMEDAMKQVIWNSPMGARLKDYWESNVGVELRNPYSTTMMANTVTDVKAIQAQEKARALRSSIRAKEEKKVSELERLTEKYSYIEGVEDMTLKELKTIDEYTEELKGNVEL